MSVRKDTLTIQMAQPLGRIFAKRSGSQVVGRQTGVDSVESRMGISKMLQIDLQHD